MKTHTLFLSLIGFGLCAQINAGGTTTTPVIAAKRTSLMRQVHQQDLVNKYSVYIATKEDTQVYEVMPNTPFFKAWIAKDGGALLKKQGSAFAENILKTDFTSCQHQVLQDNANTPGPVLSPDIYLDPEKRKSYDEAVKARPKKLKADLQACLKTDSAQYLGNSGAYKGKTDTRPMARGENVTTVGSTLVGINAHGIAICEVTGDVTFGTGNKGLQGRLSGGPKLMCKPGKIESEAFDKLETAIPSEAIAPPKSKLSPTEPTLYLPAVSTEYWLLPAIDDSSKLTNPLTCANEAISKNPNIDADDMAHKCRLIDRSIEHIQSAGGTATAIPAGFTDILVKNKYGWVACAISAHGIPARSIGIKLNSSKLTCDYDTPA